MNKPLNQTGKFRTADTPQTKDKSPQINRTITKYNYLPNHISLAKSKPTFKKKKIASNVIGHMTGQILIPLKLNVSQQITFY
jgi:hypothetical protein